MSEVYQALLSRMDSLRELYRKQGPRTYVGGYNLTLEGRRLTLPESFGLEQSEEWIVGLMESEQTLLAYESFLLGALEKDPEFQDLKDGLSELAIRLKDPFPALVYVDEGSLDIPEHLLQAAGISDTVEVLGCGHGFKISARE